jgi:hypothetical protein
MTASRYTTSLATGARPEEHLLLGATPEYTPGLLLHIGYHKTGTSWLQRFLFTSAELGLARVSGEGKIKQAIVAPHELEFDPATCRAAFEPRIGNIQRSGLMPVLSAERLCGDMLYGGYDSAQNARRLAATFPDAAVLIVFREQRQMIVSSYREYVSSGGLLSLDDYLRPPPARFPHPWPFSALHFEYDRLISLYRELFGASRVLALPYELFRSRPQEFVLRIVAFGGTVPDVEAIAALPFSVVENPAWPTTTLGARRRANLLLGGRLNSWAPLDARVGLGGAVNRGLRILGSRSPDTMTAAAARKLAANVEAAVGGRYRRSNRHTASLTGLDLAPFGYDLDD